MPARRARRTHSRRLGHQPPRRRRSHDNRLAEPDPGSLHADQLGSEQAPVRLAGPYGLDRLAQSNPRQLQSIVNIRCAYLRIPFTPPCAPPPAAADAAQLKEHQGQEIAEELGIAVHTVNRHLENIRAKVGHRRRSELIRSARSHHDM